jgi:hypothetical protein
MLWVYAYKVWIPLLFLTIVLSFQFYYSVTIVWQDGGLIKGLEKKQSGIVCVCVCVCV